MTHIRREPSFFLTNGIEALAKDFKCWMNIFLEVFINVFMKCYKFVLWQIVDGLEWRLCSFHEINGIVVWLMFGQGVRIFSQPHPWILSTRKKFYVDMVQHFVKVERKSRIHTFMYLLTYLHIYLHTYLYFT